MNEELKIIISAEIDKLKDELKKGQQELKDTEKQAEKSGSKIGTALKAAGKVVGTAMKASVAAVAAAGAAIVGVTEATREYRTQQAMLATAFQTSGGSAETAKETYDSLYRVLGDSGKATEAAQHLAQLTTEQEALTEWTTICQGVYATFGDSLPIESLTEAANETAKTGELTGALADALNWAGINEEEFKDQLFLCNDEAEREALIRKTLTGLYGDAAASYEETAKSILDANEAQGKLTDAMGQAGSALEPVVTIFKAGLADALSGIVPHLGSVAEGFTQMVQGVEGGSEVMKEGIQNLMDSVIATITNMLPGILTTGVAIIQALIEGIVASLPSLIQAIADILPVIIETIGQLLPMIIGAILEALPLVISTLLEAIAQIIITLGDILPEIVMQIVAILPEIIQSILDAVPLLLEATITFLTALIDAIPVFLPALMDALPEIIESIISCLLDNMPLLLDGAFTLFMAIVQAIPQIIPELIRGLGNIVNTVINTLGNKLGDVFKNIWNSFVNGGSGALDGIKNIFKNIPTWFKDTFTTAWTAVKNVFSTGGKIFDGIKDGILNGLKVVINGIIKGINKVITVPFNGINTALSKIKGISIAGIKPFDWISTISVPQIPELQRGGVLEKGQVGLLEGNGAEAVVPLEQNTGWLNEIARRLGDMLDTGSKEIILQVDGKTFARTSIKSINELTKQTGKLDLVLA